MGVCMCILFCSVWGEKKSLASSCLFLILALRFEKYRRLRSYRCKNAASPEGYSADALIYVAQVVYSSRVVDAISFCIIGGHSMSEFIKKSNLFKTNPYRICIYMYMMYVCGFILLSGFLLLLLLLVR